MSRISGAVNGKGGGGWALPGDKIIEVADFMHFPKAQAQTPGHTPLPET